MNKLLLLMFSFLLLPFSVSAVQSDIDPLGYTKQTCTSLSYDLRVGSKDLLTNGQVSDLQLFLQTKGYLKSEPTGYFGLMTFDAVSKFQIANGINGTGFVGPLTRAAINSQSCSSPIIMEKQLDVAPPYSYVQVAIYEEMETPSQDLNKTGNPILYRYKISAPKDSDITLVNENVFVLRVGVSFEPITLKVFSDKKFKNVIQKETVSGTAVTYITENLNFPFSPNIIIKAGDTVYVQVETAVGGTKDNAYITTSHKGLGSVTVSAGYVPQNQNYKPVISMVRAKAGGDFEAYAGEAVSIEGRYLAGNFISTTKVYLGGVKATVNQANNNLLWIKTPDLPDGTYPMTVSNENGTSDTVQVRTHGNKTTQLPTCSLATDKSFYKYGDTIKLYWKSQNATYASFWQDDTGKDYLQLPGDKLEASGSQSVVAKVIGNPIALLMVYNQYGKGTCNVTIPVDY